MSASMQCLSEDLDDVLEIVADTLRNPAFPSDELEKQRALLMAAITAERDTWWREASLNFLDSFFGDHPFALSQLGSTGCVQSFTADDLRAYHCAVLQPTNMVIALAGDFDTNAVLTHCAAMFGDIAAVSGPPPHAGRAKPILTDRVQTRVSEKQQATVVVGYPGVTLDDDRRYAMQVIDSHVGGFGGPLFRALRGDADLVYVVFAFPMLESDAGAMLAMAQCQPHNSAEVVARITNVFAGLTTQALQSNAMHNARNALVIPFLSQRQTLGARAGSAALWEFRGRGANFAQGYPDRIAAVQAEDARACAADCFDAWHCVITTPYDAEARAAAFLECYPDARAQDVYKIIFQGVAGPRHLGARRAALDNFLDREWEQVVPEEGPLWLPIGIADDWAWLNLKAWKHQGGDVAAVSDALWESVNAAPESAIGVSQAWAAVVAALDAGRLALGDDWRAFDAEIRAAGHPVKHHTQAFIDAYDPSYRVLLRRAWKAPGGKAARAGTYADK
jgi:predicted Zn-dependent peptidase